MTRSIPLLLVLALVAAAPAPAAELSKRGVMLDRVAAIVNENVISQSELDDQVSVISQRLAEQRTATPPAQNYIG